MLLVLITSSLWALSCKSWLIMWIIIEINIVSMCYMLTKKSNIIIKNKNSAIIYFLVQALASMLFIIASNLETIKNPQIKQGLILIAALIKMGRWPTHTWYLKLVENLLIKDLSTVVVISWQKLIPCVIISLIITSNCWLLYSIIPICMLAPALLIHIKIELLSIIALSSVYYNAWFILRSMLSTALLTVFMLVYIVSLYLTMEKLGEIKNKIFSNVKNFWVLLITTINLRGLPPTPLFILKLITLKTIVATKIPMILVLLIITTAIMFMYHYLWATINTLRGIPTKTQMVLKKEKTPSNLALALLTTLSPILLLVFLGFPKRVLSW